MPQPSKCPVCDSTEIRSGHLSAAGWYEFSFLLENTGVFGKRYVPKAFVCLDCGFMGNYLSETALTTLRSEIAKHER
jgi:predicted nucleic-acid-binding Zn-ribbon protein